MKPLLPLLCLLVQCPLTVAVSGPPRECCLSGQRTAWTRPAGGVLQPLNPPTDLRWIRGTWTRFTIDRDGDGAVDLQVNRTWNLQGTLTESEIERPNSGKPKRTVSIDWTNQKQVCRMRVRDREELDSEISYCFDWQGRLCQEVSRHTLLDGKTVTDVARHFYSNRSRQRVEVRRDGDLLRLEEYNCNEQPTLFVEYDPDGSVRVKVEFTYDEHQRPTSTVSSTTLPLDGKLETERITTRIKYMENGEFAVREENIEEVNVHDPDSEPVVDGWVRTGLQVATFDAATGQTLTSEDRVFERDDNNSEVLTGLRVEKFKYDSQGREIEWSGSNEVFEPAEKKTAIRRTTYDDEKRQSRALLDEEMDGTADELTLTSFNQARDKTEIWIGTPDESEFTSRQVMTYQNGELIQRVTFKDNSSNPGEIEEYDYSQR